MIRLVIMLLSSYNYIKTTVAEKLLYCPPNLQVQPVHIKGTEPDVGVLDIRLGGHWLPCLEFVPHVLNLLIFMLCW